MTKPSTVFGIMALASEEVSEERVFLMELSLRYAFFELLESSARIWKCEIFNASGMYVSLNRRGYNCFLVSKRS